MKKNYNFPEYYLCKGSKIFPDALCKINFDGSIIIIGLVIFNTGKMHKVNIIKSITDWNFEKKRFKSVKKITEEEVFLLFL